MRWLPCALLLLCCKPTLAAAQRAVPLLELQRRAVADPDDAEAAYELGLAYHAAHDLPNALAQYRTAQTLDPTNGLIHTSLQTALTERGLLQDSLAQFHTTFDQARADPAAAFNLALAAERHGLVEEAIHHYRRYLAMAPRAGDAAGVETRVRAMEQAIQHRRVRIRKLATKPRVVRAGQRAQVVFSYEVRGWGKHNYTGVVEQVSLYRDDVETHRFAQRSIRADNKKYKARLEILVPPDAAPGTYTLVAEVIAGSRRDEQIAVFTIAPHAADIPKPVRAEGPPPAQVLNVPPFAADPPPESAPPEPPVPPAAATAPATQAAASTATSQPHAPPMADDSTTARQAYPEDTAK